MNEIAQRLTELEELGLYRRTRLVGSPQGAHVVLDGERVLLLCSNNYLGLADHPRVIAAAADAAERWGAGAGASRLVSGTMTVHRQLEDALAQLKGTEAALLFGSGYLANLGVISALGGEGTTILSDALNHASIIDGCRLARGRTVVYAHGDLDHLERGLREAVADGDGRRGRRRRPLIVSDGVFSMDGDIAPLAGIVDLAERYGARVVIDDAHGTGCLGPDGRGSVAAAGLEDRVDVVIGTLGKALGSYGAFAACDASLVALLTNTARPFIFSTAPPPPAIAGAAAGVELLRAEPARIRRLQANAAALRAALTQEGFDVAGASTQIIPLVIGDARVAMAVCEAALRDGVFAQAIRPPTVPEGTSRLRLAVMATHEPDDLARAARVLGRAARSAGWSAPADAPVGGRTGDPAGHAV